MATRKKTVEAVETEEVVMAEAVETKPVRKKPMKAVEVAITPTTEIEVASNFAALLIYISKKTGEEIRWEQLGDTNMVLYSELETMRNTQRDFFNNNWIKLIGEYGQPALKKLRLESAYENFVDLEELDEFLALPADEIKDRVAVLKQETKDILAFKVKEMIDNGEIESIKVIRAFEAAVGYKLLEE